MKGMIVETHYKGYGVGIYLPPSYQEEREYPCVVIQDGDVFIKVAQEVLTQIEQRWQLGEGEETILLFLSSKNRLLEYTPWKEKALNPKFEDFGGGGDEYLEFLEKEFLSWAQIQYKIDRAKQGILGYSLSGLIAVYGATKRQGEVFKKVASLCGSFWYPNWIAYLEQNLPSGKQFYVYYGIKEGLGKKERLSKAPDYAKKTIQIIRSGKENEVIVAYDEGGHHAFIKERFYKALIWMTKW